MELRPLAFDSLGTRSMATLVETKSVRIVIDPGAALGPKRYGLPPHPIEYERLRDHKEAISEAVKDSDLVIITHYHYDHVPRPEEDVGWLGGKRILLKDPHHMINYSQRARAKIFLESVRKVGGKPETADGREISIGGLKIKFSNPVQHGNSSSLGYVLEVLLEESGERMVYTSDVEGLVADEQVDFVISGMPDVIVCDGPMTYMLGTRFSKTDLEASIRNLRRTVRKSGAHTVILDHHLVRDRGWRDVLTDFLKEMGEVAEIHTAASYMGVEEQPLEAMRDILWRGLGPAND